MNPRTLVLTALVLVSLPLIASCGNAGAGAQPVATLPPVLDTADVTAEGRLEPVRHATISPATGGLVSEVLVKEGDPVHAGDLIARIQDSQAQSLEAAQTNAARELTAAYEAVRDAQKELDAYPLPRVFVGMTAEQAARTWLNNLETARENFAPYSDSSRKSYKWNRRLVGLPSRVLMDTGAYEGMAKEYKKQVDIAWVYYRRACAWLNLEIPAGNCQGSTRSGPARQRQPAGCLLQPQFCGSARRSGGRRTESPLRRNDHQPGSQGGPVRRGRESRRNDQRPHRLGGKDDQPDRDRCCGR